MSVPQSRSPAARRAPAAGLPRIEPLSAVRRPAPFDHPDWLFEPKYDGHRALLRLSGGSARFDASALPATARFAPLLAALEAQIGVRDAVLDGTIVALDHCGRPSWRELARGSETLAYAVFDALWLNGRDLRPLPLVRRKRLLDLAVPANTAHVMKVLTIEGDGTALYTAAVKLDLEGIVAKRMDEAYDERTIWYEVISPAYSQRGAGRDAPVARFA